MNEYDQLHELLNAKNDQYENQIEVLRQKKIGLTECTQTTGPISLNTQ